MVNRIRKIAISVLEETDNWSLPIFLNLKGELKRVLFVVIIVDLYKMLLSQF